MESDANFYVGGDSSAKSTTIARNFKFTTTRTFFSCYKTLMACCGERACSKDTTSRANKVKENSSNGLQCAHIAGLCKPPKSSTCVSTRIERMMQRRSEFPTDDVEHEIEASRDHWSELDATTSDVEQRTESDLELFRTLQMIEQWRPQFFENFGDRLVIGEKIAEGGQAEIFNVVLIQSDGTHWPRNLVVKVFKKESSSLQDFHKQWPSLRIRNIPIISQSNMESVWFTTLLQNGKFAFVMHKRWGDLRTLIDIRVRKNGNRSPPFANEKEVAKILVEIAKGMKELHEDCKLVHRDLKASNVILRGFGRKKFDRNNCINKYNCLVADYEISVGVDGTGFWRAPEVLRAVRNSNVTLDVFNEKSDVYSYAMTCYEVLTGLIPFEDLSRNDFDVVLGGGRPKLPEAIRPSLRALLNRCWNTDPLQRPSFKVIDRCLRTDVYGKLDLDRIVNSECVPI